MAGASGYVLKAIRGNELIAAVRDVAAGKSLLDPAATARVLERLRNGGTGKDDDRLAGLTEQERKILDLIGEGLTNRAIGERLHLAEKTIKNYVSSLLSKLGMDAAPQAAAYVAACRPRAHRRQCWGQGLGPPVGAADPYPPPPLPKMEACLPSGRTGTPGRAQAPPTHARRRAARQRPPRPARHEHAGPALPGGRPAPGGRGPGRPADAPGARLPRVLRRKRRRVRGGQLQLPRPRRHEDLWSVQFTGTRRDRAPGLRPSGNASEPAPAEVNGEHFDPVYLRLDPQLEPHNARLLTFGLPQVRKIQPHSASPNMCRVLRSSVTLPPRPTGRRGPAPLPGRR